jgi:hypothetical protein
MPKFKRKPLVVEAKQWFHLGDHEGVCPVEHHEKLPKDQRFNQGRILHALGEYLVKPGDWIVTGSRGEFYPLPDEIFREGYEPYEGGE